VKRIFWAFAAFAMGMQAAPAGAIPNESLPFTFEVNRGQAEPGVRYLARGSGYSLSLTARDAVISLEGVGDAPHVVRMSLRGGGVPGAIEPLETAGTGDPSTVPEPNRCLAGAARYSRIRYRGVYPGIDLVYHSQEGRLEYDFVVAPGTSPDAIRIGFEGVEGMRLNQYGDLELKVGGNTLVHEHPEAFQNIGGRPYPVSAEFVLKNGRVSFRLGAYDPDLPLTIDPVVVYRSAGAKLGRQ
jgi:hypothetical protein